MIIVTPPFPFFPDANGTGLDAGYLYIGAQYTNPEAVENQIKVWWDADLSIPAVQPIRTVSGFPSRNGSPAALYTSSDFSITCRDKNRNLVFYARSSQEFSASAYLSQKYNRKNFTATEGQTDFVVDFELRAGADAEIVIYNGAQLTYGTDYSIVGTNTIRLVNECEESDSVVVKAGNDLSTYSAVAENVAYTDPVAPAYLKVTSDMLNMQPVSLLRWLDKPDRDKFINGVACTTDLIERVQEACDTLESFSHGGTLVFPRGRVYISTAIEAGNKVYLTGIGAGMAGSEIMLASGATTVNMVRNKTRDGTQEYFGLSNIAINGNASAAVLTGPAVDVQCIYAGSIIEKVLVYNTDGDALKVSNGTAGAGCGGLRLMDIWTNQTGGDGILLEDNAGGGSFSSILIQSCHTENMGSGKAGVRLKGQNGQLENVTILGHHVELTGANRDAIAIDACADVTIIGLQCLGASLSNNSCINIANHYRNVRISAQKISNPNSYANVIKDSKNGVTLTGVQQAYCTPEYAHYFGGLNVTGNIVLDPATARTLTGTTTTAELQAAKLAQVMQMVKYAGPGAPSADNAYFYLRDNGSGKMQLVARFPTGAVQIIATEP